MRPRPGNRLESLTVPCKPAKMGTRRTIETFEIALQATRKETHPMPIAGITPEVLRICRLGR